MKKYLVLLVLGLLLAGCPGNGTPQECPETEQLVCGADGITYKNPCFAQKAGVNIAHSGPCASPSDCTDSDGGKDIFTAGAVTGPDGREKDDYCEGKDKVVEFFCENGEVKSETLPCPAGYECSGGKCELVPCTDSDGGINLAVKGTVVSGSIEETDVCLQNGSLKEYYCEGGTLASKIVDCPEGQHCLDGACIEHECIDSDGGQNPQEVGTTSKGNESYDDYCINSNTVKEYYCEHGIIKSKNIACAEDELCKEGACVPKPTCVDSDGGKDRFTVGTTTLGDVSYTDTCVSETTLTEYFCEDGQIKQVQLVCGIGYECSTGKCVEQECTEEDIDMAPTRYEIFSDDEAKLYAGEVIEVEVGGDKFILKLVGATGNDSAEFVLYDTYADYLDGDESCSVTELEAGDTGQEVCGEELDLSLDAVNDTDNFVEITTGEDFNFIQYIVLEGTTYEGSGCPDDEIDKETSNFYPPLSEVHETKKFKLLGQLATLDEVDVPGQTISFKFDGTTYDDFKDRDVFEYDDVEYEMRLYFNDAGLYKIVIQED